MDNTFNTMTKTKPPTVASKSDYLIVTLLLLHLFWQGITFSFSFSPFAQSHAKKKSKYFEFSQFEHKHKLCGVLHHPIQLTSRQTFIVIAYNEDNTRFVC